MTDRNPEQIFNQALDYFHGIGRGKNMLLARKLMQEASDLGMVKASMLLADWYVKDYFPSDDHREAIELYEKCRDMGDVQSLCRLAMCYKKGIGFRKDLVKALGLYVKAYEAGMTSACFDIAYAYSKGHGVEKDPGQAVRWYQEGADTGDPECACNLAFCYYSGTGVPKDIDKARELFLEYSDFNAVIQKNLGIILYQGTETCPPDREQGIHWLRTAADNGDSDAARHLGMIYKETDRDEAMRWYARAAALDKKTGAYFYAFHLYKYSDEGERGPAFDWMKCAAENGHVSAMFMLGLFYKCGIGTEVDHANAFYWLKLAAENGYEQAYSHIGRYYRTGQIVAVNYEIALQWFEKAIVSKNDNVRGEALYDYGMMYLEGLGVSRSRVKAVAYLCQSRDLDCINAREKLKELDNPEPDLKLYDRTKTLEEGDIIQYVRMKVEDGLEAAHWDQDILRKLELQVEGVKESGIVKLRADGQYQWTLGNIDFAQWMLMVSDRLGLYSEDDKGNRIYKTGYFARLFLNKKGKKFIANQLTKSKSRINDPEHIAGEKNYSRLESVIAAADEAADEAS